MHRLTFLEPWWLLLLGALPVVVLLSYRSLSALGKIRRPIAIAIRCLVLILIVFAIADLQLVRESDRLCTLFVLDQSESIPREKSDQALLAISESIRSRARDDDLAGLVVFGRNARIELPPMQYPRDFEIRGIGSLIDREHSDPAAGIRLALGSFPPDTARRIVVISDGNQNRGNVLAQAVAARESSVPIDVVPIEYLYSDEILVDKVVAPPDLKKGDTANLKIVVRSGRPARGRIRLNRRAGDESRTVLEQDVELRAGLNVLTVEQKIEEPDYYTYEAHFEPEQGAGDRLARNNQASTFTWIRGEGKVLLLESNRGNHRALVEKLRQDNISVTEKTPDQLIGNLGELRQFDSIIVADVPAEQLNEQIQEAIVANTREMGAGLLMTGGPNSFGAGGYIGSPIEKALPVDMELKSTKVRGKGALVLIMHACEMPEGNFWEKKVAQLAIGMLSQRDECGLIYWNGQSSWLFTLREVGNRVSMLRAIDRMTPGDMPDFAPAMTDAVKALERSTAMTKHVIIISDGDPTPPPGYVLDRFRNPDKPITCTTVAIATHGGFEKRVMESIATATGGRYYEVQHPKNLPKIYVEEIRVVSKPLVFEQEPAWSPILSAPTEPVAGMPTELPPIRGLVLTTPKPTAEIPIASPMPKGEDEVIPVLAHWQYGLGRAAAFTSDTGEKWAVGWPASPLYAKFWSQLVRWTLRSGESDQLSVATQEKDGKVTVVVNAMDKGNEFINFLRLKGRAILPDLSPIELEFRQTEPGKYEAQFDANQAGSYFLRLGYDQGSGQGSFVSTGMTVPYPPEYRDLESNRDLLENVAAVSGGGASNDDGAGAGSRVVDWDALSTTDFFDRSQAAQVRLLPGWPFLLLIALVAFWCDVAVRRIAIEPAAVAARARRVWNWIRHRPTEAPAAATMERLRSTKAKVEAEIEQKRKFDLPAAEAAPARERPSVLEQAAPAPESKPLPQKTPEAPTIAPKTEAAPDTYTSRLLKAKKEVWKDRKRMPDEEPK